MMPLVLLIAIFVLTLEFVENIWVQYVVFGMICVFIVLIFIIKIYNNDNLVLDGLGKSLIIKKNQIKIKFEDIVEVRFYRYRNELFSSPIIMVVEGKKGVYKIVLDKYLLVKPDHKRKVLLAFFKEHNVKVSTELIKKDMVYCPGFEA